MLAGLLVTALTVAAPDTDPAKLLRVAWASQYEWREDDVKNITIEFTYQGSWLPPGAKDPTKYTGHGHLVVVGDKIVRVHLPQADTGRRGRVRAELDWVVARFVRQPFEELFKDAKFRDPEAMAGDIQKVTADRSVFLLKNDRIVGVERNVGGPQKPNWVRVDFETRDVGDGYGIVGETMSFTAKTVKTRESRTLKLRTDAPFPAPHRHVRQWSATKMGKSELTLEFDKPKANVKEPVALDLQARELLQMAWQRRFTLPDDIRIEGEFSRDLDKHLRRRYTADVRGKFQVWGLAKIDAALDERMRRQSQQLLDTCLGHLRWYFGSLRATPFDEEFKDCGFEVEETAKDRIVRVYGHPSMLAYRVANGAITGHIRVDEGATWWEYKLKDLRNDIVLIDRMTTTRDKTKYTLKFKMGRAKGIFVPKQFDAFTQSTWGDPPVWGVCTYKLLRLKVDLPKK